MTRDEAIRLAVANGHDMEPWSTDDPTRFAVARCRRCRLRCIDLPALGGVTATAAAFTCAEGPAVYARLVQRSVEVFDTPTLIIEETRTDE